MGRFGCGRCLEPELAHGRQQTGFLQRLRERGREQIARVVVVDAAVRAHGDDRSARVLVISTFDIPSSALAID